MSLKKIISKGLILGLLLNNIGCSFANTISLDGRYETFVDNNITVNDILEDDKTDIKIEGNTLVNVIGNLSHVDNNGIIDKNIFSFVYEGRDVRLYFKNYTIKENTTYTFFANITKNTLNRLDEDFNNYNRVMKINLNSATNHIVIRKGETGLISKVITTANKTTLPYIETVPNATYELGGEFEIKDIMVLEGDWTNKEIPNYFKGMQSSSENQLVTKEMIDNGEEKQENLGKYKVEVKSTGKNILPDIPWERGEIKYNTGQIFDSDYSLVYKEYIPVKSGSEFTLKFENELFDDPNGKVIAYYDKDKNFLFVENTNNLRVIPHNAKYIRIRTRKKVSSIITEEELSNLGNIQLEYGLLPTKYEPYKESTTTFYLNSPLLKGDTIEYINGQAYHIHNSKQVVLDGSSDEDWRSRISNFPSNTTSLFAYPISNFSYGRDLCDKFTRIDVAIDVEKEGFQTSIDGNGYAIYIRINKSKLSTDNLDGFKEWLKDNPINVVHKLTQPIYEPIKANLSVQLFEETTHILNNSNIPTNMEAIVDRVLNRAVEAIELAKENPTIENISIARMWTNLAKETIKKDELQNEINNIVKIEDLEIELKKVTSNMDVYIKSQNALSMSLSTNSIIFDEFDSTEDMEKLSAVNLTVNSSLPYRLNSYMMTELKNKNNSEIIPRELFNIRLNGETDYKAFTNINEKLVLKENCSKGNNNIFNIDLILRGSLAHKADVYRTTIRFEVEQK